MTYLANRGDDMEMRHLKVNYDLGRTRFVFYSPRDTESIKEVIADADVVVNLIGKYYESGQPVQTSNFPFVTYRTNYSFADTNVTIPTTLAQTCKEMQVDHFIHVSSASAAANAKSEWSRTKFEGEQAVREIFPWATIVRPTQLFGKEDRLLNWFARMAKWYGVVPLVDGGDSVIQPVWVGDVANALLRIIDSPESFSGRTVDCFGPNDYTYAELADFVEDITEQKKPSVTVPYEYLRAASQVLQYQRNPLLTPDLVDVMAEDFLPPMDPTTYGQQGDEATKVLTLEDLGIVPRSIEKEAFQYLHFYREGGRFFTVQGYHTEMK